MATSMSGGEMDVVAGGYPNPYRSSWRCAHSAGNMFGNLDEQHLSRADLMDMSKSAINPFFRTGTVHDSTTPSALYSIEPPLGHPGISTSPISDSRSSVYNHFYSGMLASSHQTSISVCADHSGFDPHSGLSQTPGHVQPASTPHNSQPLVHHSHHHSQHSHHHQMQSAQSSANLYHHLVSNSAAAAGMVYPGYSPSVGGPHGSYMLSQSPNTISPPYGTQASSGICHSHHPLNGHHSIPPEMDFDPRELEVFSERFKQRRIKLGVTQADVGKALGNLRLAGVGSLSQSTICRFESLTLSHNNMVALKPVLQAWLEEAEQAACDRQKNPDMFDEAGDKKRKRTSITDSEKRSLEAYFTIQPRPSSEKIAQISEKLNLKKNVVRVWFCNQRQKQKRMKFSTGALGHLQ